MDGLFLAGRQWGAAWEGSTNVRRLVRGEQCEQQAICSSNMVGLGLQENAGFRVLVQRSSEASLL